MESGRTTEYSRARSRKRLTTGLSATGLAISKWLARWSLQKYGVSNSSCKRMTCAPFLTAWRNTRSAEAMLVAASSVQANWVAAKVTAMAPSGHWSATNRARESNAGLAGRLTAAVEAAVAALAELRSE